MKCFQSFRLDTANHCLWHGEERASIAPKAYDVLCYLVEINPVHFEFYPQFIMRRVRSAGADLNGGVRR